MLKRMTYMLLALWCAVVLSACGATEAVQDKVEDAVKEGVQQVAEQASTKVSEVAAAADEAATATAEKEDGKAEAETEGEAEAPTPTQATEPEQEGAAEEPAGEEAAADELQGDIVPVGDLDSYRLYMVTEWSSEGETTTSEIWIEAVKDPPASRIRHRALDANGEAAETETIQVGDEMYTMMGDDEWMALKSDELTDGIYDDMNLDESGYSDMSDCDRVGKEKVDGLDTIHYHCNEWTSPMAVPGVVSGISSAEVDTWISTKYNAVIKAESSYKITDEGKEATVSVRMEYSDINEPIKIEKPEGVEAPGVPDDVPVIDGAQDVAIIMQMLTFTVEKPQADVLEWYQKELDKNGWTYEADQSMAPFMLSFTKGGQTLQMMLGEEGSTTTVTLVLPEAGE